MEKIEAEHVYIKDLFDDENLFEIPSYQRPFAWEKENFEQLIDDIKEAVFLNMENFNKFNKYEPYFLGSIIQLQSEEDSGHYKYSIIDGQQRLVSLVILIAVIRDLIKEEKFQKELQGFIYQEPKEIIDQPEQSRIIIRKKERDFFKEYILQNGGTLKRKEISKTDFEQLSQPKQRILTAIDVFSASFNNGIGNQEFIRDYVKYLLKKVIMVVITTRSFESAFRLFNVVNARGMPLTNADLLKSINLGKVPEKSQSKYTQIWEDIEEDIGIEKLEMLISFIRSVKLKKRPRKTIFDEFEQKIFTNEPEFQGKPFINYLEKVKIIYQTKIIESNINAADGKDVHYNNLMSIMRDFLPLNDWMAALMMFYDKFQNDDYLYDFLKNLERKIFVDWVTGLTIAERLTQIYRILKLIEDKDDPVLIINDPMFNEEIKSNKSKFKDALDHENFYSKGNYKTAKYVLLRIDMERNENLNKKISFSGNITVEHVLPRKPNRYWKRKFTNQAIQEWTNKLGNLTLLNGTKNSRASNKSYHEKVETYFKKKSDFSVTNELVDISDWNKREISRRHKGLKREAVNIWIDSV